MKIINLVYGPICVFNKDDDVQNQDKFIDIPSNRSSDQMDP